MHVPLIEVRSLDGTVEAVDLGQTPADVVFLSFSDSDLNALAHAYDALPDPKLTLRLASLSALRHPFSIDLYLEKVCARAKLVVARVLGGGDYWRYGVDELAALARRSGVQFAALPGDRRRDTRLEDASTLDSSAIERLWRYFDEGGPQNMAACLAFLGRLIGAETEAPPPAPVSSFGRFEAACLAAAPGAPHALIVFYRSIYLANDLAPIEALSLALNAKGFATTSIFVTSLKDESALAPLRALIERQPFDVVLNATAFSARLDGGEAAALDALDAPVLQVVLAGMGFDAWRASHARLGAGRSRDARRFAGDRRPHPDQGDLVQDGEPARRPHRVWRSRAPAGRRPRRLCRRSGFGLGESAPQGAVRKAPRLHPPGLSVARRADRATRSGSIRPKARSRSPKPCAPRVMTSPAIPTRPR